MTEEMWFAWDNPRTMLQSLHGLRDNRIRSLFSSRRLRLFAAACVARAQSRNAIPQLAFAIEAAEVAADARTNVARARWKELKRAVRVDKDWRMTIEGQLTRAITSGKALTAAIQASFYASYLISRVFREYEREQIAQGPLLRDIMGNPFRRVTFSRNWRTSTAIALAQQMYESRDFGAMPILADALQDAGCDNEDILNHCRDANATHVRGCGVVDLVLGKN
jgi:hypothetical protein